METFPEDSFEMVKARIMEETNNWIKTDDRIKGPQNMY